MTKKNNLAKYAYLLMVTENNNNKFYEMNEIGDRLIINYGRVGSTKSTRNVPIRQWDSVYKSKIKKGYKDVTDFVADKVGEDGNVQKEVHISDDHEVAKLIGLLQMFAKDKISANYRIASSKVTLKMVETAQDLIDRLTVSYKEGNDVDTLNEILLEIFTTIPRKILSNNINSV